MCDSTPEVKQLPAARINFIYLHASDMEAMRAFYKDALGCREVSYRALDPEGYGWAVYDMGSFQFMVFPDSAAVPQAGWSMQPGWEGGTHPGTSWSIVVTETEFPACVARLQELGAPAFHDKPQWCQDSYWSYPVQDPMGNTVELHCMPAQRPESTEWQSRL